MIVTTAPLFYSGPGRVDIAPLTPDPIGRAVGPAFGETLGGYAARLFALNRERGRVFSGLLALDRVVVVCSCLDATTCHRTTLAAALVRLGAEGGTERPRIPLAAFACAVKFCGAIVDTGHALCSSHWCRLPFDLQRQLHDTYTEGQRYTGLQSRAGMAAMGDALALIAESAEGLPAYLALDASGEPGYLAETRRAQDKAWRTEMAPRGKRGPDLDSYADMWRAAVGDRWDAPEPEAPKAPELPALVVQPPRDLAAIVAAAPPPAPRAPAKVAAKTAPKPNAKRGGWKFSEGTTDMFGGETK